MKKTEIIERLERINKELEMKPEEFCNYIKNKTNSDLKREDVYAFRSGWIEAEIKNILTN